MASIFYSAVTLQTNNSSKEKKTASGDEVFV